MSAAAATQVRPAGPYRFLRYLDGTPGVVHFLSSVWGFRDGCEQIVGYELTVKASGGRVLTLDYRVEGDPGCHESWRVALPDWIGEDDHPDAQAYFRSGHELAWWAEIRSGGPLASLPMTDPGEDEGEW